MKNILNNFFKYNPQNSDYNFILSNVSNNLPPNNNNNNQYIYSTLKENIEYLKIKYNLLINSDIKIRNFDFNISNKKIHSFLFYIDGMVEESSINDFILKPIFLKSSIKMNLKEKNYNQIISRKKLSNTSLENFLYSNLIPQTNVTKENNFKNVISKVNSGFCALFVENLNIALCIEAKGIKGRSVDEPVTEAVVKGAHEGFVENLRINTSLIRKIINNENLIIEETEVGEFNKTKVSICYIQNITNDSLVSEVKYRINNIKIDYLLSTGQLTQLIKDNYTTAFPQTISTERPDKTCNYLLLGRVAILINGSPFAIIVPAVLIDFLTSPEDYNLNYVYANFLKFLRVIAFISALLVPGMYVAITMYHYELLPSELLFAIIAAREAIPFPIIFEIIIMEGCFELIQEASIRVPSSFSTTVGIIGALILGDAAVSANIVSPILIIIVAFSGICSFAIPDNSLRFSIKLFRFFYIILGYLAGFLGIGFGFFIHFSLLAKQNSFGVPFFAPYIPLNNLSNNENLFINPMWKREKRNLFLNTKRPNLEPNISMKWRKYGK